MRKMASSKDHFFKKTAMINKKPLTKRVRDALMNNESARKSGISLCTHIWNEECRDMGKCLTDIDIPMFLHYISQGKLSKQQTILRYARKMREKHPHLRKTKQSFKLRKQRLKKKSSVKSNISRKVRYLKIEYRKTNPPNKITGLLSLTIIFCYF